MVSPHLVRKKNDVLSLNHSAKRLFQMIYAKKNNLDKDESFSKIKVSEMVSKLSFVYEKIRNAVDYDDEYLLRKNAIKRILRRQIMIEGFLKKAKSEEVAMHLLVELIQAGYLENNKVPEAKVLEISKIIEKHIKLKDLISEKEDFFSFLYKKKKESKNIRTKKAQKKLLNWIISLAASEIEINLLEDKVKKEMVLDMFEIMRDNIDLPQNLPYEDDLEIQIYLGIARNFLNYDTELLSHSIFKYYNKNWGRIDESGIEDISQKIDQLVEIINIQLNHPLKKQIDKVSKAYSLYFSVLEETIEHNPLKVYDQAINNYKSFINLVKEKSEERFRRIKSKLWRAGGRSILYIFLTKSIFVFLIEIPAIKWFNETLNVFSLAINVSFPAFLLFIMILFTWAPAQENTKKIIEGVEEIVFSDKKRKHSILLKKPPKRSLLMDIIFGLLYLGGFFLTIFIAIKFLTWIGFNWVNITIFLFFLMFVSFFSFRIKREIKRFIIIESKDGLLGFLFDFLYTPIMAVGKFLSDNASRINVFIFILDFIIEAPFKVFVEVFDEWLKYMKERKEDLVN